ncbi:MAG: thermonuclease family protein [Alphaproteobacteria bacterium]
MIAIARTTILGLCLLAAPAIASETAAAGLSGMPEVIDGDTIVVAGETVRLFGIDAPEMGQHCAIGARTYDCGAVSRTALLDLTAGTPVTCELMKGATSADSHEGKPGRCFAAGYDLSEGMAYTGWALAERNVTSRYDSYETGAQKAGRGLWKGDFVSPWAWRDGERLPQEADAQ